MRLGFFLVVCGYASPPACVCFPSHLGLNSAWLRFLHSSLIAVILCVVSPVPQLAQDVLEAPAVSFCKRRFEFSSAAVDKM